MNSLLAALLTHPEVLNQLAELAVAIVGLILTVVLPWLAYRANKWFGIRIEEKHMKTLHEAIATWAATAVKEGLSEANGKTVESLKLYLQTSVPEAYKFLSPAAIVLVRLGTRYIQEARK